MNGEPDGGPVLNSAEGVAEAGAVVEDERKAMTHGGIDEVDVARVAVVSWRVSTR